MADNITRFALGLVPSGWFAKETQADGWFHRDLLDTAATAAPTIGNSTQAFVNSGATITINVPSGTANGNLLLLFASTDNRSTVTTPTGWTLVDAQVSTGSGNSVLYTFQRRANSEPASYNITNSSGTAQWSATMVAISGADGVGAFSSAFSTFGATFNTPAITAQDQSYIFSTVAVDNSITLGPTGVTLLQEVTAATAGRNGIWMGDVGPVSAGSFGPYMFTSGGFPSWAGITVEVFGSPGSGGGISGTAAITLGALTSAATGTLPIAGTASVTLGALTSVATGTLAIKGQAAITLGDLTVASTGGATPINGSAAVTLDALTAASTGALALKGQAAVTLGALTAVATGTLPIVGQAAITLGQITSGATGVLPIVGASGGALAALSLAATATLAIVAAAGITLGDLTLISTGAGSVPPISGAGRKQYVIAPKRMGGMMGG